jgi:glutamate/tyrosine decarboxylase-like PLP-dependent enzyme
MDLTKILVEAVAHVRAWEAEWGPYEAHPSLAVGEEKPAAAFETYTERLRGNYPFFHPRYAGQMLKPPHPAAVAAYVAAMLINPNNHALDGGPPTGAMEKEVVRELAAMFRFPADALGHLTSSGTLANLEALWVARELRPDRAVAFSTEAHYTHGRMSEVLRVPTVPVPADAGGRIRLDALEDVLRTGAVGTVVLTAGTTALGAVDPIADALDLCARYDCRVHVDAAYGGFFTLLAHDDAGPLAPETRRHLRAVARADSVAIDPHKHGLQPYGCGAILFRDPSVGRFYKHDSPYTYFTSDALHLGEISLECSRAGAAAGALWLTLRLFPLRADEGLGPVLAAGLRAARRWHALLDADAALHPFTTPELDIVTFFAEPEPRRASTVDDESRRIFTEAMLDPDDPVFLSVLRVESEALRARLPGLVLDRPRARILRSVLMKPEHEPYVPRLHDRVRALAGARTFHARRG